MPDLDGIEFLKRLRSSGVATDVVMMTGYATVENAVEAMKLGSADFIGKPFTPDEIRMRLRRVLERSALIRENLELRRELKGQKGFEGLVGGSRQMERVYAIIRRVSPTDGTVLIAGESGTGKEMVAAAIHRLSPRKDQPFLACDCSALAPTLLASELFGHVKGSFTGAVSAKQGLFEVADKGTLFLDEISNLSKETQGTLLRVLETRRLKRVGDTQERSIDIRLITATNRDLQEMVRDGTFREDLYYRLHVVPIDLPPLRERTGDIPRLAMVFLERFREKNQVKAKGFTPEAMAALESSSWPGNVRELKNTVERMAILCDEERIGVVHLPRELQQAPARDVLSRIPHRWSEFKDLKQQVQDAAIREMEKRFLLEALQRSGGNVSRAAEDVCMQRTNFHSLLRKHGLTSADAEG